jgi:hypothetical protein
MINPSCRESGTGGRLRPRNVRVVAGRVALADRRPRRRNSRNGTRSTTFITEVGYHRGRGLRTLRGPDLDAISPREIHWESPSNLDCQTPTTLRYVEHARRRRHILIFAREAKSGPLGTQPLLFLGPAEYVHHEGSRPVSFRCRLNRPMPTEFSESARVVAS